jgi:hypothetical protein
MCYSNDFCYNLNDGTIITKNHIYTLFKYFKNIILYKKINVAKFVLLSKFIGSMKLM